MRGLCSAQCLVCRTTVGPTPTCPLLTKAATPVPVPPPSNFLPTTSCLHPRSLPAPLDATVHPLTPPVAQYFYPVQEVQAAVRVARDGHHYCCQGWPRMRTPAPRIVAKPAAAAADTQQSTHTQRRQLATPLPLFCNGYTWLQNLFVGVLNENFSSI